MAVVQRKAKAEGERGGGKPRGCLKKESKDRIQGSRWVFCLPAPVVLFPRRFARWPDRRAPHWLFRFTNGAMKSRTFSDRGWHGLLQESRGGGLGKMIWLYMGLYRPNLQFSSKFGLVVKSAVAIGRPRVRFPELAFFLVFFLLDCLGSYQLGFYRKWQLWS